MNVSSVFVYTICLSSIVNLSSNQFLAATSNGHQW